MTEADELLPGIFSRSLFQQQITQIEKCQGSQRIAMAVDLSSYNPNFLGAEMYE